MSTITSTRRSFWRRLIEPHPSLKDAQERMRATLLAGATLFVLAAMVIVMGYGITQMPSMVLGSLPVMILFGIAYALSRSPRPVIGAYLLVIGLSVAVYVTMLQTGTDYLARQIMVFQLMPLVLGALVLRARTSVLMSALILSAALAIVGVTPWLNFLDIGPEWMALFIVAVLISGTGFLRERDVRTIQKQADDLNRYSASLEAEIRNIITTAQVGQAITGTRNVNQLLKQVTNLIVERFDLFYHAQVFLVDDARQWAILQESTGEAGARLLARNHRLAVGSQSVIGLVTANARPIVVSDTDIDPVHRRNELLPNTRSEMALPLIAGGQVIGALDIQSTHPNAFRESDIRVFQTMADQLSVAIENARLFERAQRDLQEIETLNRRLTGEGWRRFETGRSASAPVGYQATAQGIQPILPADQPTDQREGTLTLPLLVRGEPIGMIDVTPRSGELPDPEVRTVLEQVAERVALALDSTRLSEQALRQAEREQVLSRLSVELQATTDLDIILKAAAREASRALGTPRGFVHLIMEYGEAKAEAQADT